MLTKNEKSQKGLFAICVLTVKVNLRSWFVLLLLYVGRRRFALFMENKCYSRSPLFFKEKHRNANVVSSAWSDCQRFMGILEIAGLCQSPASLPHCFMCSCAGQRPHFQLLIRGNGKSICKCWMYFFSTASRLPCRDGN